MAAYHRPVRIAMIASECEPFAKTGGLADVVDALSRALGRDGHEGDLDPPWYRHPRPPPAPPPGGARPLDTRDPRRAASAHPGHGLVRCGGRLPPATRGGPAELRPG